MPFHSVPCPQDEYWLSVYVLLSRLHSLDDLLLLRPPDQAALAEGPPQFLVQEFQRLYAKQRDTLAATDAELAQLSQHSLRALVTLPLLQAQAAADSAPAATPSMLPPRKRPRSGVSRA